MTRAHTHTYMEGNENLFLFFNNIYAGTHTFMLVTDKRVSYPVPLIIYLTMGEVKDVGTYR